MGAARMGQEAGSTVKIRGELYRIDQEERMLGTLNRVMVRLTKITDGTRWEAFRRVDGRLVWNTRLTEAPAPKAPAVPATCDHQTGDSGCELATCWGIPPESTVIDRNRSEVTEAPTPTEVGTATIGRAFAHALRRELPTVAVSLPTYADTDPYGRDGVRQVQAWQMRAGGRTVRVVAYESRTPLNRAMMPHFAIYVDGVRIAAAIEAWGTPDTVAWRVARPVARYLESLPATEATATEATATEAPATEAPAVPAVPATEAPAVPAPEAPAVPATDRKGDTLPATTEAPAPFTVDRDALAEALAYVVKAITARTRIPVLTGVLITVTDGCATFTTFDLDTALEVAVPATTGAPGRVLIGVRSLHEAVKKLRKRAGAVTFTVEGTQATVTCGAARLAFDTLPVEDYPALPVAPATVGTVPGKVLADALAALKLAAETDAQLPTLTGVHVSAENGCLSLMTTDRYRLAVRDLVWSPVDTGARFTALPRVRVLTDAVKPVAKAGGPVTVGVTADAYGGGWFALSAGAYRVTTSLIANEFPPVRKLVPAQSKITATATVDVAALTEVVDRAASVLGAKDPVRLTFTAGTVTVEAGSATEKNARESLPCEYDGKPLRIAFNPAYLMDGLKSAGTARADIGLRKPTDPPVIRPVGTDTAVTDALYMIQPIRITDEPVAPEAPGTEAPGTEAPEAPEAPATEAPATEAPATEAPGTEAPEAPATEAPASDDTTDHKGDTVPDTTEAPATEAPTMTDVEAEQAAIDAAAALTSGNAPAALAIVERAMIAAPEYRVAGLHTWSELRARILADMPAATEAPAPVAPVPAPVAPAPVVTPAPATEAPAAPATEAPATEAPAAPATEAPAAPAGELVITLSPEGGTIMTGSTAGDGVGDVIGPKTAHGWRFSKRQPRYWYVPRSAGQAPDHARIASAAEALRAAGLTVRVDVPGAPVTAPAPAAPAMRRALTAAQRADLQRRREGLVWSVANGHAKCRRPGCGVALTNATGTVEDTPDGRGFVAVCRDRAACGGTVAAPAPAAPVTEAPATAAPATEATAAPATEAAEAPATEAPAPAGRTEQRAQAAAERERLRNLRDAREWQVGTGYLRCMRPGCTVTLTAATGTVVPSADGKGYAGVCRDRAACGGTVAAPALVAPVTEAPAPVVPAAPAAPVAPATVAPVAPAPVVPAAPVAPATEAPAPAPVVVPVAVAPVTEAPAPALTLPAVVSGAWTEQAARVQAARIMAGDSTDPATRTAQQLAAAFLAAYASIVHEHAAPVPPVTAPAPVAPVAPAPVAPAPVAPVAPVEIPAAAVVDGGRRFDLPAGTRTRTVAKALRRALYAAQCAGELPAGKCPVTADREARALTVTADGWDGAAWEVARVLVGRAVAEVAAGLALVG